MPRTTYTAPLHDKRAADGRYCVTPPCDGCGKPVGTDPCTDDAVCGGSDGPGFRLCSRKRCQARLARLTVDERREIYTTTRRTTR